jgi:uncharacterized protein (TIGR00369 family)
MEPSKLTDLKSVNINDLESFIKKTQPIMEFIGIRIVELGNGYSKIEISDKKEIRRFGGFLDGGVILAVMDLTGALAVFTVNDGRDQVTQEIKVNFLEPMTQGPFFCEGRVIRKGRHTVVVDIEFKDNKGVLGGKGLGTWFLIR